MRPFRLIPLLVAFPAAALAQTDVEMLGRQHGVRPPPIYYEILRANPNAFQFSRDNGWVRRGRAVSERRAAGRGRLAGGVQLSPQANVVGGVLQGTLNLPVLLILFSNTNETQITDIAPQSTVQDILFGTSAPPYSITTYYDEISQGNLEVTGTVQPWRRVSGTDEFYENNANGLTSLTADLLAEIVQLNDVDVDFGQFDNDGPDGIPNSGDDDGYVDAVVMFHPELDGACGGNSNMWAHRWTYQAWKNGQDLLTNDAAHASNTNGFSEIRVRDYVIQGGQGGGSGCTGGAPPAIGLVTHELGHILDLPDLYNTSGSRSSHGIGHWGLMGSGNWRTASSPAHMEAWSRAELGWITEVVLSGDTSGLEISPIETADTAYILPIDGTDQYFLLENRQALGSDKFLAAPGLLIWHIDSVLAASRGLPSNTVNAFEPEAVRLIQADGKGNLQLGNNRGDAGDPYPGSSGNTVFGFDTDPASNRNDGTPTFIQVSNILQVSPDGPVSVDIVFGVPALITANDTLAKFRLDGVTHGRFVGLFEGGTEHDLAMDATQLANNGGNRYTWLSWSNGMELEHTFTATGGDTITADVKTEHLVKVTIPLPNGTVTSAAGDVVAGEFVLKGDPVQLVAEPGPGNLFEGWSGDVVSANTTLDLTMTRPYRITATFASPLGASSAALPAALMGAGYSQQLSATGGIETFSWQLVGGALPEGVQLASNGTLTGRPAAAGSFAFDAKVTSGSQTATQSYLIDVTMPVLSVSDVVTQVVGAGTTLTADHVAFLDLVGNKNGRLDVGDFLGWLQATEQSASASVMRAVQDAERERP